MGRITDRRHKPDRGPGWQPGHGPADCGNSEQRPWASCKVHVPREMWDGLRPCKWVEAHEGAAE